jgi:hypothetical protein
MMSGRQSITTADTSTGSDSDTSSSTNSSQLIMPPTASEIAAAAIAYPGLEQALSHDNEVNAQKAVPVASGTRVSFADKDDDDVSSVDSDYSDEKPAVQKVSFLPSAEAISSATSFKYKPVSIDKTPESQDNDNPFAGNLRKRPPKLAQGGLGTVSMMYDLSNKGYLTEEEQFMREMDVENKGYLTKEQVYEIVKRKLEEEYDVKQYKRLTCWMLGFTLLLTLCGFGTSYTSAILSKEISADNDSGAVLVKNSDRVVGFDGIGDTLRFTELKDAEYTERRERVLREMKDPELAFSKHGHRRYLANSKSSITIVFDQGKVSEKDLEIILVKCNAGNVVNIERYWKNSDGSKDKDYDTICGPDFTVVNKQGPKKKSKNKGNVRLAVQQIVFKKGPRKGQKGEEEEGMVSFSCEKGWW